MCVLTQQSVIWIRAHHHYHTHPDQKTTLIVVCRSFADKNGGCVRHQLTMTHCYVRGFEQSSSHPCWNADHLSCCYDRILHRFSLKSTETAMLRLKFCKHQQDGVPHYCVLISSKHHFDNPSPVYPHQQYETNYFSASSYL